MMAGRARLVYLLLAGALVAGSVLLVLWDRQPGAGAAASVALPAVHSPVRSAVQPSLRLAASAPARPAAQMRPAPLEGDADPTRDLKSYVMRGQTPTMAEVIAGLHERGVYSGLGAFQPPGTRPPLRGLAVPEDFELPPGYMRHYQATDDGQRIEALLMFVPGWQLYDEQQRPIAMPEDGVVPPELAPAGLPLRQISIPPPSAGDK
ncbi:hypothetical protein [Duganella qianjiadongensis]|uniref:Uncharacterized protein n=1 Tax=Duganella qianjiadongensis TaxID=2692176 RepID=A0ABW9VM63_9BURK|nr:hypothetical protein [Duganella qianjiadongensis]MYM40701.1 hypothetical protein [Duganella qianjiadongensis]